ncbi:hypothetical protein KF7HA_02340 [Lactococcus lactis]|nr:hypothetical protein [Lactococcus lactis]
MDFSRVLRLFELYKQDDIDVSEKLFITIEMFFLTPINEIPEEDFQLILEGLTQKIIGDNSREETVERDMKGNILEEEKKFMTLRKTLIISLLHLCKIMELI